jgi:Xaa-Pro aminopeptidase
MGDEIARNRVKAVHASLRQQKVDCLVVTKPANVSYITGFFGDDSWAVVTERAVYLITDSRYAEQAESECPQCQIIQRTRTLPEAAAKVLGRIKSLRSTAVESCTSLAAFKSLKKQVKTRLRQAPAIIEPLRAIKGKGEVVAIRAAADIAACALNQALRYAKPGVTENELAGRVDFEVRRLGGRNSFETIAAFGRNGSRPHHKPGTRKLRDSDTILIDWGVRYKGYCCDLTRCFVVGRCSSLYERAYKAVREAQRAAVEMVKDGSEIEHVDSAARAVIKRHGFPVYGHGTGHGLGLEIHEEPIVANKKTGKLRANMVLTVEPAVYVPGKLGVRIEDDVLVTGDGSKILSHTCPEFHVPRI